MGLHYHAKVPSAQITKLGVGRGGGGGEGTRGSRHLRGTPGRQPDALLHIQHCPELVIAAPGTVPRRNMARMLAGMSRRPGRRSVVGAVQRPALPQRSPHPRILGSLDPQRTCGNRLLSPWANPTELGRHVPPLGATAAGSQGWLSRRLQSAVAKLAVYSDTVQCHKNGERC